MFIECLTDFVFWGDNRKKLSVWTVGEKIWKSFCLQTRFCLFWYCLVLLILRFVQQILGTKDKCVYEMHKFYQIFFCVFLWWIFFKWERGFFALITDNFFIFYVQCIDIPEAPRRITFRIFNVWFYEQNAFTCVLCIIQAFIMSRLYKATMKKCLSRVPKLSIKTSLHQSSIYEYWSNHSYM